MSDTDNFAVMPEHFHITSNRQLLHWPPTVQTQRLHAAEQWRARLIAVTSLKPSPAFPGVLPMATAAPGFSVGLWTAVFAPAGMSPALAQRLVDVSSASLPSGHAAYAAALTRTTNGAPVEAATAGPLLVIHPAPAAARAIANRLRKHGLRVALMPDDWAAAAGGVDVVVGSRGAVWAPCPGLRASRPARTRQAKPRPAPAARPRPRPARPRP